MIIAGYANQKEYCWPSQQKIADKLGVTSAAVNKQISILEKKGYLFRVTRFHPETRARLSSVIILNCDVARDFCSMPEVFSAKNKNMILMHLLTLLGLEGLNFIRVTDVLAELGYTKKKNDKNKQKSQQLKIHAANSWLQGKENLEKNKISAAQEKKIQRLYVKIALYTSAFQRTMFDIELRKGLRGVQPERYAECMIERMRAYIQSIQAQQEG